VGVGTGAVVAALREHGCRCLGLDLSAGMLRHAIARLGPCVVRSDAHHLPVRTASVANLLYVWVLNLVSDPVAVLAEARRVLVDGGRVVAVTVVPSTDDDIEPIISDLRDKVHRHVIGADDVVEWGAAAGLSEFARSAAPDRAYLGSPAEAAANIEQRTFSYLWNLDENKWTALVEPTIAALRALPDPDRARERVDRQDVTVLAADPIR
jgi:SAM-dependent methyltransferase